MLDMKPITFILVLLFSLAAEAQIQLRYDSSYASDGALVMRFKMLNPGTQTVLFKIDKRRSLLQLNNQGIQNSLTANTPQSFIVFYVKDKVVDETVTPCDFQQQQNEEITLHQGQEITLLFQTHCLSKTVLSLINKGKTVSFEMYIRYVEGTTIQTVKTVRSKLKVKKQAY